MVRKSLIQFLVIGVGCSGALAAEPPVPNPATKPKAFAQFGVNSAGITPPEMRDAIDRLQTAGLIEGRRGSLTFFRWADGSPPKLAHLGLWGPKISNELLALTSNLPDLEHVSIYETDVNDAGLAALAKLPKLRTLAIAPISRYEKAGFGPPQWSYPFMEEMADRPRITGKSLRAFTQLATLENLSLLDAQLQSSDLALLAAWPKLSSVSLPNVIDDEAVEHLQACRKVNHLTLGYREVTAAELRCLSKWKTLRKLTLIHAQLKDESLSALAQLETVEELTLEDCGITDERLPHLHAAPKLSALTLKRNEINGPGLEHLAKLKLKSLGLEFNNISDAALVHLPQLTTVEDLALSYCRGVTDRGVQSGTLQGMKNLKQLGLRGLPQVTDASLAELVKFGHLQHLTIRETKISPDGVAHMKRQMPHTVVFK